MPDSLLDGFSLNMQRPPARVRRSRPRGIAGTASLIGMALLSTLGAQSFSPACAFGAGPVTDPARAEQLIEQANKLRSEGQDQKAVPLLKQAYDLAPSPRAAGQLGLGELAVGYALEADRHLDEALAAPAHPWVSRHRAALEAAQKAARARLVSLAIDGTPTGAQLFANGQAVGSLPLPSLTLAEGRVALVARAPGFEERSQEVTLTGGDHVALRFDLRPSSPLGIPDNDAKAPTALRESHPTDSHSDTHSTPGSLHTVLPLSLATASVVSLGLGIWQHVAWRGAQNDFEKVDGCYAGLPNHGTDSRCVSLYDTLAGHRTWTYVAYGAAGAFAVGAGLTAWLTTGEPKTGASSSATSDTAPPSLPASFAIAVAPSAWALSFHRAF